MFWLGNHPLLFHMEQNTQTCFYSLHCPKTADSQVSVRTHNCIENSPQFVLHRTKKGFKPHEREQTITRTFLGWTMPLRRQRQINQLAWSHTGLLCKLHSGNPDTRPLKSNTCFMIHCLVISSHIYLFIHFFSPLLLEAVITWIMALWRSRMQTGVREWRIDLICRLQAATDPCHTVRRC